MIKKRSILLVEDDIVDVMIVKRAFKDMDVQNSLNSVSNGEEALVFLDDSNNEPTGLILLDLNMPKMDGFELMKRLNQSDKYRTIPVIVMTTSNSETDRYESFNNGIAGYMVKPVDYCEVLKMVATIKEFWTLSEIAN